MGRTIIVSAFPAMGKSYLFKNYNGKPYSMLDSDSSLYSWIYEDGVKTNVRNPNFIQDYMAHIKENIGKVDCIFVSSHKEVRQALRDYGFKYFMVHPALDMKEEILERMRNRGNDDAFVKFQEEHYEQFITEIKDEIRRVIDETPYDGAGCKHVPCLEIELTKSQTYMTDRMIDSFLDDCMGNPVSLFWNFD